MASAVFLLLIAWLARLVLRELGRRKRTQALVESHRAILERITAGAPLTETLDSLVRLIESYAPGTIGSILLLDEDRTRLRHAAAPGLPDAYTAAIDGIEIGEGVGSCGTAAFRGRPVIVEDIERDPLWVDFRELARELHDHLGQSLTGLKLSTGALARTLDGPAAHKVRESVAIADHALSAVRTMALDLRPPQLDQLGLVAALRDAIERFGDDAGVETEFVDETAGVAPDTVLGIAVFRVAQEALTNVTRHAEAKPVVVELRSEDGDLVLVVGDDGVGFDYDAARARAVKGTSMGVLGMEERVALAGGTLRVASTLGQGTRVLARFPLAGHAAVPVTP
jgi:signal transduction histidine kinase